MPVSVNELIEKSIDQRSRGQLEEALLSALAAVGADKENITAWWQLGLARSRLKDWNNAVTAYRKVVELNPEADNAWAHLGTALDALDEADEAEEAYREALEWDSDNIIALTGMAAIYNERNCKTETEEEISILKRLESSSVGLNSIQNSRIGSLHYALNQYHEAIKYWRNSTEVSDLHNIGLALNAPDISQDADAIDMWRLALQSRSDYKPSLDMISTVMPRMSELTKYLQALNPRLLQPSEFFDVYVNPIALLNIGEDFYFDEIDNKQIQKYRKLLLQEIELEEGHVSWLDGAQLDKSRAIKVCEELNDDNLKFYHSLVLDDAKLLSFLTKGDIEHFLVGPDSPLESIKMMNDLPEFRDWLGEYFSRQYDRVLSRSLDGQNLQLIECLLDGRRWVAHEKEYQCFQNSRRTVDRLVQPLRDLSTDCTDNKPSYDVIASAVNDSRLISKLNLLPLFFEDIQNDALANLRNIAIECVNTHQDAALSERILILCQEFKFKSLKLEDRISKDVRDIEAIIQSGRKYEVALKVGDNSWRIDQKGVELNGYRIKTEDVESVRWGETIVSKSYGREHQYLLSVRGRTDRPIVFNWNTTTDLEAQKKHFDNLVTAALAYLVPALVREMKDRLRNGEVVRIGPCTVKDAGIEIPVKGWFSTSIFVIPWERCAVTIANGEMTVCERGSNKNRVSFSFKETENAVALLGLNPTDKTFKEN